MSHFSVVGGGSKHHLRPKKKQIHHLIRVTHGNSAISAKIGEKNLKSPHPTDQADQNNQVDQNEQVYQSD